MSPHAFWEGTTPHILVHLEIQHLLDVVSTMHMHITANWSWQSTFRFRQLKWASCRQIWEAQNGSGGTFFSLSHDPRNTLSDFSFVDPTWDHPYTESIQGVLRDMRPQLLSEGNPNLFPPFILSRSYPTSFQIFPSFWILLLGRILSGVSTSCLYSVFEVKF